VHLEARDNLSRFRAVIAVDRNAIPEHLERLLKTAIVRTSSVPDAIEITSEDADSSPESRHGFCGLCGTHTSGIALTRFAVDHANKFSMKTGSSEGS
jgi:hypothetical protein